MTTTRGSGPVIIYGLLVEGEHLIDAEVYERLGARGIKEGLRIQYLHKE